METTEIKKIIAQLNAELVTVKARSLASETLLKFLLDALITRKLLSKKDALWTVEQTRSAILASGADTIDTDPTVRQALDITVEFREFLEFVSRQP
ncbi:MAG: hypothetical protein ABF856_05195 [Acetobacter aceti]